jgi:hypothetical protein
LAPVLLNVPKEKIVHIQNQNRLKLPFESSVNDLMLFSRNFTIDLKFKVIL